MEGWVENHKGGKVRDDAREKFFTNDSGKKKTVARRVPRERGEKHNGKGGDLS